MAQKKEHVVIVTGYLVVDPPQRKSYLADSIRVVEQARQAPGCLDFAVNSDPLEPGRINILERGESQAAVEAFRGSGPTDDQSAAMLTASVAQYDVADVRQLT